MSPDALQTLIYVVLGFVWIFKVDESYEDNKESMSDYEYNKIKTQNRVHFTVGVLYLLLGISRYYKNKKSDDNMIGFQLGTTQLN